MDEELQVSNFVLVTVILTNANAINKGFAVFVSIRLALWSATNHSHTSIRRGSVVVL